MNLADLPREERSRIEAEKVACFVRKACGHLAGRDRQVCAIKILDKHPEDFQDQVKAAMARMKENK